MALIIRIDVDRPYGRQPFTRHLLSRLSSDWYLPKIQRFGYLRELIQMLGWLNEAGAQAYVFFRHCTLPSTEVMRLLEAGKHEVGLHLENSRSYETFSEEKIALENHTRRRISSFSKHGSGGSKYGRLHYAPYELGRYIEWAKKSGMSLFLGNLEDPTLDPVTYSTFTVFPSAFWLEPYWRDLNTYDVNWLIKNAVSKDIVMLVHPENVIADPELVRDFKHIITTLKTRTIA